MTEPQNLTTRLLQIIEAVTGAGSPNSLSDVHAAVAAILGPEGAQVSLNTLLTQLTRDGLADLESLRAVLTAIKGDGARSVADLLTESYYANSFLSLFGRLGDIEDRIDKLQFVLGADPYSSTETGNIRAILLGILQGINVLTNGPTPPQITGQVSSGPTVVEGGRRYAVWTPPINGVVVGANGYDLTAEWQGWKAYVQTTSPEMKIAGAVDVPNTWVDLAGSGTINFSVDAAYPIRAWIAAEGLEIIQLGSVLYNSGSGYIFYGIDWPNGWATRDRDPSGVLYTPAIHLAEDATGYRFRKLSGGPTMYFYVTRPNGTDIRGGLWDGSAYTVPETTGWVSVASPASEGPFTIELVRPVAS